MIMTKKRMFSLSQIGLFTAIFAVYLISSIGAALAEFRAQQYTSFIQTNATARFAARTFGRGGFAFIAGGVVLNGQAQFYLEDSRGAQAVSPGDVTLRIDGSQNVYLNYRETGYKLEAHRGIACPLGQFIARNGAVGFTIPPNVPAEFEEEQERQLREAGLVFASGGWIAKEFANTNTASLLEEADFADTVDLPDDLNNHLIQTINAAVGGDRDENMEVEGSYVNTDSQITYQVYLLAQSRRVDVAGVPLRYSWSHANDGSAIVTLVEAFSTDWPKGSLIADLSAHNGDTSQYDYVVFYQTGGIFRQIFMSNPTSFRSFVAKACAS